MKRFVVLALLAGMLLPSPSLAACGPNETHACCQSQANSVPGAKSLRGLCGMANCEVSETKGAIPLAALPAASNPVAATHADDAAPSLSIAAVSFRPSPLPSRGRAAPDLALLQIFRN